jgi:Ca-activated chloride channel family protein
MSGDRLEGAKRALLTLVDRLDPADHFGVVAFDDAVQVVVPAGPLADKAAVKHAVMAIDAGGSTDLSSGYLRGLQEAERVGGGAGARVLVISDGHANAGVVDPDRLGRLADGARAKGITTSTLGFGLGYDERLLAALARGGAGDELFAEETDAAVALIQSQASSLLDLVAQAASLRVTWTPHVAGIEVLNDLPVVGLTDGALLELGSFYAGESRKLVLRLRVPGIAALGLTQVATLAFTHVSLPDLVQHTTSLPVHVNVVPGDQAAGHIPDPAVRSEALFQRSQKAKRDASRLLSQGRVDDAVHLLGRSSADLRRESVQLPDSLADELLEEAQLMDALAEESQIDAFRAAKATSYDASRKSRLRGRTSRGGGLVLRWAVGDEDEADSVLLLEEWEVHGLTRLLQATLARLLRPSSATVSEEAAQKIGVGLPEDHPARSFFLAAGVHGGFTVERA